MDVTNTRDAANNMCVGFESCQQHLCVCGSGVLHGPTANNRKRTQCHTVSSPPSWDLANTTVVTNVDGRTTTRHHRSEINLVLKHGRMRVSWRDWSA